MDLPLTLESLALSDQDWGTAVPGVNALWDANAYAAFAAGWRGPKAVPTKAALDAAWAGIGSAAAYSNLQQRTAAATIPVELSTAGKLERATAGVLVDEINALRDWITAFKAAVAAASTFANLQARVAALPAMPDRTLAQARDAIVAKINSGAAD